MIGNSKGVVSGVLALTALSGSVVPAAAVSVDTAWRHDGSSARRRVRSWIIRLKSHSLRRRTRQKA